MTLQEQLEGIAEKLSQLDNNNRGDLAEISRLTTMQNEILAQQALEERVQVQEVKVSSIVLPYDFNELFGDENANDIVIELIKDLQRQAYAEHNEELTAMAAEHRELFRAATDRELQLKRQNDELQASVDDLVDELNDAHKEQERIKSTLTIEITDALTKRDEALARVAELEVQLAEKAKEAGNVLHIAGNDRLSTLVEKSKNAKVKSALDIALENTTPFRGKVGAVAELNTPEVGTFQPIDQTDYSNIQLVTGPAASVPTEDQVEAFREEGEVQAVQSGLVEGSTSENGQTLAEAFKRIEALEAKLGA